MLRRTIGRIVHSRGSCILRQLSTRCSMLSQSLRESDPQLADLIRQEEARQRSNLSLIASENVASAAVHEALSSKLCNKYSEGLPGARYYGGNEWIDKIETLCRERALACYGLDPKEWGVNVQPLSGSPANFQVYTALLDPGARIMGLDLYHGGHLSHGFVAPSGKRVSATSQYFESMAYRMDEATERVDMARLSADAAVFRPKLIIAGVSAYPRLLDYRAFRGVCDTHGAYLLADMAHISGLVAAGCVPSPFQYADVVTTTTHKTLRGPRGAMIFYRKRKNEHTQYAQKVSASKINSAVFPGLQGGPHNHSIAAIATALKQAMTPEFHAYQRSILANAKRLAVELDARGYSMVAGGTDTHIVLVDLKRSAKPAEHGVDGQSVEDVLDSVNITVNKNTVPGDKSAMSPFGVRVGTASVTSRGCVEDDMARLAHFFDSAVDVAVLRRNGDDGLADERLDSLRAEVVEFIDWLNGA